MSRVEYKAGCRSPWGRWPRRAALLMSASSLAVALPAWSSDSYRVITSGNVGPFIVDGNDTATPGDPPATEVLGLSAGQSRATGGAGLSLGVSSLGFGQGMGNANGAGVILGSTYEVLGNPAGLVLPLRFTFAIRGALVGATPAGIFDASIRFGIHNLGDFGSASGAFQEQGQATDAFLYIQGGWAANDVSRGFASWGRGSFFENAQTLVSLNRWDQAGFPSPATGTEATDPPLSPLIWDTIRADARFITPAAPGIAAGSINTLFSPGTSLPFPVVVESPTRSSVFLGSQEIEVRWNGLWTFDTAVRSSGFLRLDGGAGVTPYPGPVYGGADFTDGFQLVSVTLAEGFETAGLEGLSLRLGDGSLLPVSVVPEVPTLALALALAGVLVLLSRPRLRRLSLAAPLVAVPLLTGCAQMSQLPEMVANSASKALARNLATGTAAGDPKLPDNYLPLWDSELKDIFVRNPRTSSATTFPRVIVTVEDAPPWHAQITPPGGMGAPPGPGCWRFRAKVWTDAKTSRTVKPFHLCNYDRSRPPPAIDRFAFEQWAGMRVRADLIATSGDVRNEGPDRPFTAVPRSVNWLSHTNSALGAVARITGVSVADGDPRLWFNLDLGSGQ
jgi:hypothetical protein